MATLEVKVWGENLRLSSDQDGTFIQQVADYLNEKMNEVLGNDATLLTTKIAALRTAYCIAAEYLLMSQEMNKLEFTIEQIEEQFESLQL